MDVDLAAIFESLDDTEVVREDYIRCPFPYPGSKYRSLEYILPHLPYYNVYCEPFGGSGAVLLGRKKSKLEIFNDRYSGVVAFYRCIRDRSLCDRLVDRLNLILHSREEFIWSKETWRDCEDNVERAARWYYMIVCSFSSQGRNFGRSVKGNGMVGSRLHNNLKYFYPLHNRLQNVQIENLDWIQCLKDYDSVHTVFYLDPPYLNCGKEMFEYSLDKKDHITLCEKIFQLEGFVALSGYENEIYEKYPWNKKLKWEVKVKIFNGAYTKTNNQKEEEPRKRIAIECLYIKEASYF